MAFIPVTMRADIANGKKGRVTPEHSAVLQGFSLSKDTGILNVLNNCVASTLPGSNKTTLRFGAGYFVVKGRLFEVEQNTDFDIAHQSGSETGYVIARVNLASTKENEFKVELKPGLTLTQGDLYNTANKVYEFPLYKYMRTAGGVTIERDEKTPIISTNEAQNNALTLALDSLRNEFATELEDLEARVAEMGFSEGSVTALSGATLRKYGKYAILQYPEQSVTFADQVFTIRLMGTPFVPKNTFTISVPAKAHQGQQISFTASAFTVTFTAGSREVTFRNDTLPTSGTGQHTLVLQANSIGFEIV